MRQNLAKAVEVGVAVSEEAALAAAADVEGAGGVSEEEEEAAADVEDAGVAAVAEDAHISWRIPDYRLLLLVHRQVHSFHFLVVDHKAF